MKKNYKKISSCRSCKNTFLTPVLSLGEIAVSNFIEESEKKALKAPLDLVICDENRNGCGLLQLLHSVNPDLLYSNYWYESGINNSMRSELKDIVKNTLKYVEIKENDLVVDIGANDGTLLRNYKDSKVKKIGFEPAKNLSPKNKRGTDEIIQTYFSYSEFDKKFYKEKAKIITAIGMFYDVEDPKQFVNDVELCLHEDGVFVIQMMYLPEMLRKNAFDGICHEHITYYSLLSLLPILTSANLFIYNFEMRPDVNEGSIRIYIKKKLSSNLESFIKYKKNVDQQISYEKSIKLTSHKTFVNFKKRINSNKNQILSFIKNERGKGKIFHGYAASTKGNTTLQYYDLNSSQIDFIAERNPEKYGKKTISSSIKIISENESRKIKPDYYFVLAWHFIEEFIKREKKFLESGGKMIVPMPEFKVISNKNYED